MIDEYIEDGIEVWDSMRGKLPDFGSFIKFYVRNRIKRELSGT